MEVQGGNGWLIYGRMADGTTFPTEACLVPPGSDSCEVGGTGAEVIDVPVNSTEIAYGFRCPIGGLRCVTGATIHGVLVAIYSSVITIDDPTPPAVATPVGPLVDTSRYHRGSESVSFNGSDALGLKERRLYIDGFQRDADQLACDDTKLVPCSNPSTPATFHFDLSGVGDGDHTVQVAVVDAANNETRSTPLRITVDQTPPRAPRVTVGPRELSSPSVAFSWASSGTEVAPIAAGNWTLCAPSGTCQSGSVGGTSMSLLLHETGTYTLAVSLTDAAGNTGASTTTSFRYAPRKETATPTPTASSEPSATATAAPTSTPAGSTTPAPQPTATPSATPRVVPPARTSARLRIASATFSRSARTLSISGTASAGARGRVKLTASYRRRRHAAMKSRHVSATLRNGRLYVALRVTEADARAITRMTIQARYPGDSRHLPATARRTARIRR